MATVPNEVKSLINHVLVKELTIVDNIYINILLSHPLILNQEFYINYYLAGCIIILLAFTPRLRGIATRLPLGPILSHFYTIYKIKSLVILANYDICLIY